jgi:Fe2+ transport system protein FeoA
LVIVCGWLLAVGVGAVLWFNTTMAADAFERHELEVELADLAEQRAIVLERINDHESPASLADRARDLGMLPGTHITYVRLSDGSTIGQPVAAGEESEEVNQESEWAGEESGEESLSQPPEAEL